MTAAIFDSAASRLAAGERLTDVEADELARSHDIVSLGMLADEVRRRRHGLRTTFVRVATIAGDAAMAIPPEAGEVRLVGPPASPEAAVDRVSRAIEAAAGKVPVTAFALNDLDALSRDAGVPLTRLLESLRRAGLEWIAEAGVDRMSDPLGAYRSAADTGLRVARCTLREVAGSRALSVLRSVRDLVDRGVSVVALAPLAPTATAGEPSTGYEDVKLVALARLLVDNVDSIQVDWSAHGPKLAQVALTFGANDLDAVPAEDDPGMAARRRTAAEVVRNIRAAAQEPAERNGRFELLTR